MEVVMLEMLHQIPGPIFMLLYGALIIIGIVIGRKWIAADGSARFVMPDETRFDSIALSYLRGGINSTIRIALLKLIKIRAVDIDESSGKSFIVKNEKHKGKLESVEEELYMAISGTISPSEIFKPLIRLGIESRLKLIKEELTGAGLLRSGDAIRNARIKKGVIILLLLAVGLTKLYMGIIYNKPFVFLTIMISIEVILFFFVLKTGAVSTLGKKYMTQLAERFAWARDDFGKGNETTPVEPDFAAALFGTAVLVSLPAYETYARTFPARQTGDSSLTGGDWGTSNGCGGSTGGSDGGGGDSGGGGCGGCGGGGD
jgi:uncharacterized protein (TIGR04222 family)